MHCSVVTDQDGDEVVLMESEWISLHLLPRMQAIINRFVFRPTGNDIVEALHPKIRRMGGGLLMDCLEEQDWRFQELKEKPYPYKITKTGPEEGQVVFETDIVGWVGSDGSGIISKLLSNLTLRRTVTLRSGQPFFRFDFEFINRDRYAKRPTFWPHNSSIITLDGDETVLRPSERGILSIRGPWGGRNLTGEHYIFDFNHGWSVSMAHERKEGIVYLMDYDYVRELYNCLNSTVEWRYDSILSFQDTPWKGHIYILPIIGLSDVHYANEYFICQLNPKREEGKFVLEYRLASSYEKVAQITFNARLEYNLLEESPQSVKLKPVIFDSIGIEPVSRRVDLELDAPDPLALDLTAFVELSDGTLKTFNFETYYAGEYKGPTGPNSRRDGKPVKLLRRPVRRPRVPDVPAGLVLNRKDFNVFAVFGLGTMRLRLKEIVESIPGVKLDIGYCTGSDATGYGLGDFPYDYDRLFSYRVLLFSNIQDKEYRSIGASILLPWLQAGGGLVISGGEHAFTYELREHEINAYYPVEFKPGNLRKGACQLQQPEVQDHPIFRDLDLTDLPYLFYCHDLALKEGSDARVLMKVGGYPLIIEKRTGEQITMVVTANHFGTASDFEGKTHLRHWKEWPKLYAQIVRYAAHDLK
ncbi:MAG: hypothetical protein HYU36_11450 [Planctomycetes bacterium]|nr:hypothetical protein [Planctomycetota bacterium]